MSALLQATGLGYPGRVEATDLSLAAGTITMLVGPNGAGKTSLLHAIAGIGAGLGEVAIDGVALAGQPKAQRARLLSYLPASRDVAWPLVAADFVALGWPRADAAERAAAALASVEAEGFAARRIDRLSTGERARVMLARALVAEPRALLLDEPIANLDPQWRLAILDRLRRVAEAGAALLVTVHDLDVALGHADRVIVMDAGRIVADGTPEQALSSGTVARVFGVALAGGQWVRAKSIGPNQTRSP